MDRFAISPYAGERFHIACAVVLHDLQIYPLGTGNLAKALSASCSNSTGGTASVSKRVSPDSTRASVNKSSVSRNMRAAFLRMISRNSRLDPELSAVRSRRVSEYP